ncbi:hypothetical protein ACWFPY_20160 [Nocardia fluminea]
MTTARRHELMSSITATLTPDVLDQANAVRTLYPNLDLADAVCVTLAVESRPPRSSRGTIETSAH